jgi:trk system potassium uptake protein TrkH
MINFRIIARVLSQVLIIEGICMLVSGAVSWIYGEPAASSFLYSALITLVTGFLVFTPLRHEEKAYGTREGYILYTGIWILFSMFGTLPYLFSSSATSFTDAFFESISGFTTTGATIFNDVESLPKGILFWRSLTQWLGGLTIITLSFYVLPVVKSLNIQISTTEFSGQTTDKIHPKIVGVTKRLATIYLTLTIAAVLFLIIGRMPFFDAVCQSLSTLSTGGFSTRNDGMAAFSSPYLMTVITLFMFFGGTNPTIFYFAYKRNARKIAGNNEFGIYLIVAVSVSLLVAFILAISSDIPVFRALQAGFFHVVSVITTTGYYTMDWSKWTYLLSMIVFILMFAGGMAGSASGGIKIIRLMIIVRNIRNETRRLIHPEAYLPVRIDKKIVQPNIVYNLLIFMILYFMTVSAGAFMLSFFGYDIITSFSTTASMLANIGPGIGTFGPFSDYSGLHAAAKWILSLLMLTGRLELFAVIILFTGNFHKK